MSKELRVINVTPSNIDILEEFIQDLGRSSESFRYFKNREMNCIKSHLLTLIYLEDNSPVCYGHLDKDGEDVWLGISVIETKTGIGLGKKMMFSLTNYALECNINNIKLSVDKNNLKAISLYEKFGFKKSKDGDNKIFMNLNLGEKNG